MKSTSTDPRALRTQALLRDALMQCVVDKPFRDITIRDITKDAGVNRATFYLHYEDKYDLLEDCARGLFAELREVIEVEIGIKPVFDPPEPFIQHHQRMGAILQHFQQHSAFYQAILGKDGDPMFYNLFRDTASNWIRTVLTQVMSTRNQPVDEDMIDMMVRFQSAGNLDVLIWWLENDMPVPIDTMAERLSLITMPPLLRMLHGKSEPC